MMASLFSGVSGLKNHQVRMNVIGNNIANINTIGFKSSRANFQEALVQTYKGAGRPTAISGGTNPVQIGLGMQVAAIDNLFSQGGLETTGQITDLAIQGSGFFILGDSGGNKFYTRAGAFGFDGNSNLVDTATGLYVLGKLADTSGQIPSLATTGPIRLPFGQQDPARATTSVTLANNLDASATESDATLSAAGASGIVSVSGRALDGVGGVHTISISGNQSQAASFTGTVVGLSNSTTLTSLGVTDYTDFSLTVDGGSAQPITGMSATSTVGDLINAINQIDGLTASLSGGAVRIVRDKAGAPADFGFQSNTGIAGNMVAEVFGVTGASFTSAGGAASTYTASDSFMPAKGTGAAAGPIVNPLNLVFDENTGLVTGLSDLGGGGVEISSGSNGLTATSAGNELVVETEPTTHTASISVFDSQGGKHTMSIEFFKSIISNRWEWTASTLGNETIAGGGTGFVSFNADSSLNTFAYNGGADSLTLNPGTGADNLDITFNAGTFSNYDGLTQFASGAHTASIIQQDGYGLGILEKIDIDQAGNISGIFSNGITRVLAQIMMADFSNQAGLRKSGRSAFQQTANSGAAVEGIAGATISGQISSGALEASNVDIAQEFTGMITAQRGFQANARIITTSDNMLDELVNIKR
jgi:flagellar hook protein FlgE